MRRRTVAIGLALIAAIAAIALVVGKRKHGGSGGAAGSSTIAAGQGGGAGGSAAKPEPPADPRTLPRAHIEGHVLDEAGKPIAGAQVCATGGSELLGSIETREPTCSTSKDDGAYALGDLIAASYSVFASAAHYKPAGYEPPDLDGPNPLDLRDGHSATKIDITLRDGGVETRGRVKDIGGGTVAGAWVTIYTWGLGTGGNTLTRSDARGEFSAWVAPGQVWISARAEGYAESSKSGTAPGQMIEVLLTPESVLVGRVIDADSHAPIEGAIVNADEPGWNDFG
jgi:hypothetical protein